MIGPRPGADRRRVGLLVLLAVACVALVAATYLFAFHTAVGARLDTAARPERIQRLRDTSNGLLDTISVSTLAVAGLAAGAVALVRGRPRLAVVTVAVVVGANVSTQVLKHGVLAHLVADAPSFPSGHTTVAMSLAVAAVLVAPVRWRGAVALVGSAYATLVGAAVVAARWHEPSEAIGALFLTTAWAAAGGAVLVAWRGAGRGTTEVPPDRPGPGARPRDTVMVPTVLALGALVLVAAAGGVVAAAYLQRRTDVDAIDLGGAFLAGVATIGAVAFVLLALLELALGRSELDPRPTGQPGPPPGRRSTTAPVG